MPAHKVLTTSALSVAAVSTLLLSGVSSAATVTPGHRLPDTITVRDRLPPGRAAVLINRNHTYTDLYLPIDARQERLLAAIDGERTVAEICRVPGDRSIARAFFQQLWRWDQVVFDTSRVSPERLARTD